MTSGTVSFVVNTLDPHKECVVLSLEDNDVYGSRKFANIGAAEICSNSTSGTASSVSFTAGTVKVHGLDIGTHTVTLTLYGK